MDNINQEIPSLLDKSFMKTASPKDISRAVVQGENINARRESPFLLLTLDTPLLLGILHATSDVVERILREGADPETKTHEEKSPLIFAVQKDDHEKVYSVIRAIVRKHNSDDDKIAESINYRDSIGNSALHYFLDNERIFRALMNHGADINAQNNSGATPLLNLIRNKSLNAQMLGDYLQFMADPNIGTTINQYKPIHAITEHEVVFDYLLDLLLNAPIKADLNAKTCDGRTIAHFAVSNMNKVAIDVLAKREFDMNIKDEKGRTTVHYAGQMIFEDILEKLHEAGADLNAVDHDGNTGAHIAVLHGHFEMVRQFKILGARMDIVNKDGFTPIDLARKTMIHARKNFREAYPQISEDELLNIFNPEEQDINMANS